MQAYILRSDATGSVAATSNIHRTAWLARVAHHLFFETMVEGHVRAGGHVHQTNNSYRNRQPIRANQPFHCWLGLVGLRLHSTVSRVCQPFYWNWPRTIGGWAWWDMTQKKTTAVILYGTAVLYLSTNNRDWRDEYLVPSARYHGHWIGHIWTLRHKEPRVNWGL